MEVVAPWPEFSLWNRLSCLVSGRRVEVETGYLTRLVNFGASRVDNENANKGRREDLKALIAQSRRLYVAKRASL